MREKMELRTKKSAVILTACAPVALSVLPVLAISLLVLPPSFTLMILGLMIAACGLTMAFYIPSYLGSYTFQPATSLHGARIVANLGRANTYEVSGVSTQDILVKQSRLEKRLRVCHIRVKGTAYYFRGVPEMEKVQAALPLLPPVKQQVRAACRRGKPHWVCDRRQRQVVQRKAGGQRCSTEQKKQYAPAAVAHEAPESFILHSII